MPRQCWSLECVKRLETGGIAQELRPTAQRFSSTTVRVRLGRISRDVPRRCE